MDVNTSLVVPIQLKAFVFNKTVRRRVVINNADERYLWRWKMNYAHCRSFESPESPAFSASNWEDPTADKRLGVYLHWTLPAGLRHGVQKEDGTLAFPLLPNRWLVVRMSGPAEHRTAKAFLIKSDYFPKGNHLGSPFFNPEDGRPRRLGGRWELNEDHWNENESAEQFPLTAIGLGDPNFLAYQPHVKNIVSFHDEEETLDAQDTPLSYLVIGWYADASKDIIRNETSIEKKLAELNWVVNNLGDGAPLESSIYLGWVHGVDYQVETSALEKTASIHAAMGNTAIDALTAILKRVDDPAKADLLSAFQYGLLPVLDEPSGPGKLDLEIRKNWFSTQEGGLRWVITDKDTRLTEDSASMTPEEQAQEKTWFDELNRNQDAFEKLSRQLEGLKEKLFILWWKKSRRKYRWEVLKARRQDRRDEVAFRKYEKNLETIKAQIQDLTEQIRKLELPEPQPVTPEEEAKGLTPLVKGIQTFAWQKGIAAHRELRAVAREDFHMPADPVLLITGVNQKESSDPNRPVRCRAAEDLLTGFTVNDQTVSREQITGLLPGLGTSNTPALVKILMAEWFMADPDNAAVLSSRLNVDISRDAHPMLSDDPQQAFDGELPAFPLGCWSQPWNPLFIEWQVEWYPIPYQQETQRNWAFNGREYEWNHPEPWEPQRPQWVSGRTFLTPENSFLFHRRLDHLIEALEADEQTGDEGSGRKQQIQQRIENLKAFRDRIGTWDFLAQSLVGFNERLLQRHVRMQVFDDDREIRELTGDAYYPLPALLNNEDHIFQRTRQGQLCFNRLSIYDTFGQEIKIVVGGYHKYASLNKSHNFRPVPDQNFKPQRAVEPGVGFRRNAYNFMQLPPRLLQFSRLNFHFLDTQDEDKVVWPNSGLNPLFGWIIPNHLDESLVFFDPQGLFLGELMIFQTSDEARKVTWKAAPESPYDNLEALESTCPWLARIIRKLLNGDGSIARFEHFLNVVDQTLWTVDPLGTRPDQHLSVLVGRPLALVRARLQFELAGPITEDPWWKDGEDSNPPTSPEFPGYTYEVRLGSRGVRQDGLIGYFLGQDVDHFHAVHQPVEDETGFVKIIEPGNFIPLQFEADSKAHLTLLLDPRAQVSADCGLLPPTAARLPAEYVEAALGNMEVTFRTGPLMTVIDVEKNSQNEVIQSVTLPTPAAGNGVWSWLQYNADEASGAWQALPIKDSRPLAEKIPDKQAEIRDGYLKLSNIQDT